MPSPDPSAPRKDSETQASEEAIRAALFTSSNTVCKHIPAHWLPDGAPYYGHECVECVTEFVDRVSGQALERAAKAEAALQAIADYSEPLFDHPPEEWAKHTPETCAECAEWKARKHPIQHACDGFYRLLYSRDDHRAFDRQAEGPRMRMLARKALEGR